MPRKGMFLIYSNVMWMENLPCGKIFHDVVWNILPHVQWVGKGFHG
jgi:hypothetical protein